MGRIANTDATGGYGGTSVYRERVEIENFVSVVVAVTCGQTLLQRCPHAIATMELRFHVTIQTGV
jgi:hypothetical protein